MLLPLQERGTPVIIPDGDPITKQARSAWVSIWRNFFKKNSGESWVWWSTPIIPATGRLEQEDPKQGQPQQASEAPKQLSEALSKDKKKKGLGM